MQQYDAELRAWALYRYQGFVVIVGQIYGDKKGRFPDGKMIQTSPLLTPGVARNGNVVATLNSHYLLVGPKRAPKELRQVSGELVDTCPGHGDPHLARKPAEFCGVEQSTES